jgi:hypothetical protein
MSYTTQAVWTAERCASLLAKPKRSPQGWKACCPAHEDSDPSLFLADGENGVALVCYAGCDYKDIAAALEAKGAVLHAQRDSSYRPPSGPPESHFQLGAYQSYWDYRNGSGTTIMRVCRWEQPDGKKDIRPLVKTADGWKWAHHPNPRPLFQLDRLTNEPDVPVIMVEGEKTAMAAQKLFPDRIATTWPGGAASTGQIDMAPLTGRSVVLIPDCDAAGRKAMAWMQTELKKFAKEVRIVDPADFAPELPKGWDLADALIEKRDVTMWLLAPTPAGPVRRPMLWTELKSLEAPIRTWAVDHWLGVGTTLLAGRGGIGKTLLAQTLATALALGRNFLDAIVAPKKVLFWACEDDHDELWRRQIAICKYLGVPMDALEGQLMIEPRSGLDNTLFYAEYGAPKWTPLMGELGAQVNDYCADVTFIDNIGQTFGGKENDRHHVTTYVNGMTGLARGRPHGTVILAHPGKQEDSEFSGSTAWENSVRMRWYMGMKLPDQDESEDEPEADPDVRYIAKRKTNYTVKDYRKLIYRQGVFETALEAGSGISDRYSFGRRDEAADEIVLKALDRFAESSVRTTEGKSSPDYLPRKIRDMKLAQDFTQKELFEAMNRLRLGARIVEGPVGKYPNRSPKIGLMRAPIGAQS